MLLSALFLTDVGGVNTFKEVSFIQMTEGDQVTVYFQLRDNAVNTAQQGYNPVGRRYVPAIGATLMVVIPSLDPARQIVKICTQPYAQDPSIWSFTIAQTDQVRGTQDVNLLLSEGGKLTRGMVKSGIRVSQYAAQPPF